jgi:23S rRNA (adenine2030-N6)-methyltransferase
MNYRHAFHAGNFADLVKHAALTLLLDGKAGAGPLTVIDTHGGAGVYDLAGEEAKKSGEAQAGIARLMAADDAPPAFAGLKAAVRKLNGGGVGPLYPGSPALILRGLKSADRFIACELRPAEHAALSRLLTSAAGAKAVLADGFDTAMAEAPAKGRLLVLIDPPFEQADDYDRCAETLAHILRRNPAAVVLIWLPLKDLETFDAFIRNLPQPAKGALVAEARLRPLMDPMRMNGCALLIANPPTSFEARLGPALDWVVSQLGEARGIARQWRV